LQDVHEAEHAQFMQWSRDLAVFIGLPLADKSHWRAAQRSIMQMAAFFSRAFTQGRVAAGSLLARLAQAQAEGDIDEAELIAQSAMLLFAGHETTRHLLGTGVLRLLENPAQWQLLQTQPALAANAVRELLRYEPPVQYTGRRARADFEFAGQAIKRNDLVLACIAAAHRDAQRYPQAEQLDIARSSVASLAFGSGAHVCIGAALTQMEAEITLTHISQRWPQLRLAATAASADWDHSNLAYRGLNTLLLVR
jgi:cytochrome P450